jgi:hypothetical protein
MVVVVVVVAVVVEESSLMGQSRAMEEMAALVASEA